MANQVEQGVGCLLLAAGEGTRFTGIKQLAFLNGRLLLDYSLSAALDSRCKSTTVVLGAHSEEISRHVDFRKAKVLGCPTWKDGMSSSLKLGIRSLSDMDAVVVVLGDQPLIGPDAIDRLIDARGGCHQAVRATYSGCPGHPVLLERDLFKRIAALDGDLGARQIIVESRTRAVPCDDVADPMDVDTLADAREAGRILAREPESF